MKLRNKKTGGIFDVAFHSSYKDGKITIGVEVDADPKYPKCNFSDYRSLEEFCEHWEDYKPAEPLIKDESDPERAEKIRKAIRTWAEALHIDQDNIKVSIGSHRTSVIGWQPGLIGGYSIDFPNILNELRDGMQTTITELCGEEEECEN